MSVNLPLIIEPSVLKDYLHSDDVLIVDLSSPATYVQYHIPGAVFLNYEWTDAMDMQKDKCFKPEAELRQMLENKGLTPDKTIVVYCHTHHRSAHTYIMLKSLSYKNIKGYPDSWSDWGNEPNTPIEKD